MWIFFLIAFSISAWAQVQKIDNASFVQTVNQDFSVQQIKDEIATIDVRDSQYQSAIDGDKNRREVLLDQLTQASDAGVAEATEFVKPVQVNAVIEPEPQPLPVPVPVGGNTIDPVPSPEGGNTLDATPSP